MIIDIEPGCSLDLSVDHRARGVHYVLLTLDEQEMTTLKLHGLVGLLQSAITNPQPKASCGATKEKSK